MFKDMNEPANFGTNDERPWNWPVNATPYWSLKCPSGPLDDPPYRTSKYQRSERRYKMFRYIYPCTCIHAYIHADTQAHLHKNTRTHAFIYKCIFIYECMNASQTHCINTNVQVFKHSEYINIIQTYRMHTNMHVTRILGPCIRLLIHSLRCLLMYMQKCNTYRKANNINF